jgi:UMF1 family MFS transporter
MRRNQEAERGTSWFRMLVFGLVHQFTHSSRWAILTLIVFSTQVAFACPRSGCVRPTFAGKMVPAVI